MSTVKEAVRRDGSALTRCVLANQSSHASLSYRVDEGVPQVQSSGVRRARARALAPAAAATALEPQIHAHVTR